MKVLNDKGLAHLWEKIKSIFVPNTTTINDKPLSSNITLTASDLNAANKIHTHTKSQITDFPTKVSEFENDKGYLTEHQSLENYQLIGSTSCYDTSTSDTSGNYTTTIPNITELKEGLTVKIRLKITPNGNTNTLNINDLGAKTIYFRYGSKLTTHYAKESILALTYTEDAISSGTDRTGWIVENVYDSTNTWQLRKYYSRYTVKSNLYRYMMCFVNTNDELIPANNISNSTATTKTLTTESFDIYKGIYYYYSLNTVTSGNLTGQGTLYQQFGVLDLRYSFNTGTTLIANKPIYLVVTPQSDGQVKLSSNPISQELPTETTNDLYVFMGKAYNTSSIELTIDHPVYTYTNKLIEVNMSILDKADKSYVDEQLSSATSITILEDSDA